MTNIFKRPDLKALGVAGGTDRLLLALDQAPKENSKITYVVCTAETKKEAIKIVDQLRGAGICTEFSRADRLSDGLRQAEKRGAMVSVLVLPKEIREGKAKIKLMRDRSEELVSVGNLVEKVQATLNSNK